MKIVQHSSQTLRMEDRNWLIGLLLIPAAVFFLWLATFRIWPEQPGVAIFVALFGAGGCVFGLLMASHRTRLVLDRSTLRAELTIYRRGRRQAHSIDLAAIRHVKLETHAGQHNRLVARPAFVVISSTGDKTYPIVPTYGPLIPNERLVQMLNAWLASEAATP